MQVVDGDVDEGKFSITELLTLLQPAKQINWLM
jgi:hypothetical protein